MGDGKNGYELTFDLGEKGKKKIVLNWPLQFIIDMLKTLGCVRGYVNCTIKPL